MTVNVHFSCSILYLQRPLNSTWHCIVLQRCCNDQGRLSPLKPMTLTPPEFHFPPPPFSLSLPFCSLSILRLPPPNLARVCGSTVSSPSRKRILTHLRASKRTSWQHLSAPPILGPTYDAKHVIFPRFTGVDAPDNSCRTEIHLSCLPTEHFDVTLPISSCCWPFISTTCCGFII